MCHNGFLSLDLLCGTLQPGQSAPEMAAAAAAAAVMREAAASAVMDVLDAGESEEEKTTKLALAKEDKMRKVIRLVPQLLQYLNRVDIDNTMCCTNLLFINCSWLIECDNDVQKRYKELCCCTRVSQ